MSAHHLAAVAIGRNEGPRLVRSLASLQGRVDRIVYVDSGSTDGSVEAAKAAGCLVIALDLSLPFTAARARNAGLEGARAEAGPSQRMTEPQVVLKEEPGRLKFD